MSAHFLTVALAGLVASAALAQTEAAPPPPAPAKVEAGDSAVRPPESAAPGSKRQERVRLHSSHTVDVIVPGEKVETIVGRMRVDRPAGADHPKAGERRDAVRGPDKGGGPGRGGPGSRREGGRGPPHDGQRQMGTPPPSR